jgi:hypothetical protein
VRLQAAVLVLAALIALGSAVSALHQTLRGRGGLGQGVAFVLSAALLGTWFCLILLVR